MTTRFRASGRTSASEAVRKELDALIRSGDFEVGESLPSEQELARSFGVSRPVVREALQSLRAIGLIVSRSGRGSFVQSSGERGPPRSLLEPAEWVHLDASLHAALTEASGNRLQVQLVEMLRDALVEQSVAVGRLAGRIVQANREHRAIYKAGDTGDEAAAREAMASHLVEGQVSWQLLLGAGGEALLRSGDRAHQASAPKAGE